MQASLPHTHCALLPQRDLQAKLHFYLNIKLYLFKAFSNALFICTAVFYHSDAFKCLVFPPHLCLRLTKLAGEQKPTVTIFRSTDETRHINALRTQSAFKIYTGPHEVCRTKENLLEGLAVALWSFSNVWSLIMPPPLRVMDQWTNTDTSRRIYYRACIDCKGSEYLSCCVCLCVRYVGSFVFISMQGGLDDFRITWVCCAAWQNFLVTIWAKS